MYQNSRDEKKERRADVKRFWNLMFSEDVCFSENIEWFGKKVLESEAHRRFEMMWRTYLTLIIKMDNKLFLGDIYWNIDSKRVARVYRLLFVRGYAERIIQLALGASNLYAQVRCDGHYGKSAELKELAERYGRKIEEHRQKYTGNSIKRVAGWNMIRLSNEVLAEMYDIIEEDTRIGLGSDRYQKGLKKLDDDGSDRKLYWDTIERLLFPRKYKIKQFRKIFQPRRKNRRKRIS